MPHTQDRGLREEPSADASLRLGIPKGRMFDSLVKLFAEASVELKPSSRGYRPSVSLPNVSAKILKPQNIVTMLAAGTRDCGFAGADWVRELTHQIDQEAGELVEVLDTGLDTVRLVAAAPREILVDGGLPTDLGGKPLRVAGEMSYIATEWIRERGLNARFVRTYGATEVFPPEDADCIVDITQTGATLEANNLVIVDEIMRSSTRLYASSAALEDAGKGARIDELVLILKSALDARKRAMLELNVAPDRLDSVLAILPAMRSPTISQLRGDGGFAVKAAVVKRELPGLIPRLKAAGGTDIVITNLQQVVP